MILDLINEGLNNDSWVEILTTPKEYLLRGNHTQIKLALKWYGDVLGKIPDKVIGKDPDLPEILKTALEHENLEFSCLALNWISSFLSCWKSKYIIHFTDMLKLMI